MIERYEPRPNGPLVASADDPVQLRIARERAASPLVPAALGDATAEPLSPTEWPGARGVAAIASPPRRLA